MHKVWLYNSHVTKFPFVDDESISCMCVCVCVSINGLLTGRLKSTPVNSNNTMCICIYLSIFILYMCIYDFIAIYFPPQLRNQKRPRYVVGNENVRILSLCIHVHAHAQPIFQSILKPLKLTRRKKNRKSGILIYVQCNNIVIYVWKRNGRIDGKWSFNRITTLCLSWFLSCAMRIHHLFVLFVVRYCIVFEWLSFVLI